MTLTTERTRIAEAAQRAGLIVDSYDLDASYHQNGEHQSQYIEVVVDCGVDENGYKLRDYFTIRVSDHYQVKSCGAKANICTFSDGEEKILAVLAKIGVNKQAFLDCIENGGDVREFANLP